MILHATSLKFLLGINGLRFENIEKTRKLILESKKRSDLESYEEICDECFGVGKKCHLFLEYGIVYEGEFSCKKCNGKGKWNWIDKIKNNL